MAKKSPINLKELERYYDLNHEKEDFPDNLLNQLPDDEFENANTWLLKRYLENGNRLPANIEIRILDLLPLLSSWEAKLHLLQILPYITVPKSRSFSIREILLALIKENNKFIRAWAYNGLYHLQTCHLEFKTEMITLLNKAYSYEAPSIKARIRNILRDDEWLS
ncbi:MAG: hypothetical protein OXH90_04795 [Paracoccaceae bacterium]|nr:hypothetical protein [Paracoccaceae bacterium]MDE2917777.1 hypothetical protein [Paracoccaceae bacterium]